MRRVHWLIGTLALAAGGTFAACDTVEPGDYVVYRVSVTSAELSDGCYWQYHGADANVRADSSSLESTQTFVLYAGVDPDYLLDIGEPVLDGEIVADDSDGEVYEFSGKAVDVTWDDPNGNGAKRTTSITTKVDLTVDGKLAFGEMTVKTAWSCNGNGCGDIAPACTESYTFVGTEVEDVQLEHDVPPGLNISSGSGSGSGGTGNVAGEGGSGGEGAEGGSGGEGGGVVCNTCNDLMASEGTITEDDLCASSLVLYQELVDCSCGELCGSVCGDNFCVDVNTATSECSSCNTSSCGTQFSDCLGDAGDS